MILNKENYQIFRVFGHQVSLVSLVHLVNPLNASAALI